MNCISRDKCIEDGATIYEEKKTCIKDYFNCTYFGGYLYRGEDGDECVSVEKCLSKEGWHPYSNPEECLEIDPAPDGDFIERADGICSCLGYSVSGDDTLSLLLYLGDTAQCISNMTCYFSMQSIYYSYRKCASRQDLLDSE